VTERDFDLWVFQDECSTRVIVRLHSATLGHAAVPRLDAFDQGAAQSPVPQQRPVRATPVLLRRGVRKIGLPRLVGRQFAEQFVDEVCGIGHAAYRWFRPIADSLRPGARLRAADHGRGRCALYRAKGRCV
jgi:hypothetical protein